MRRNKNATSSHGWYGTIETVGIGDKKHNYRRIYMSLLL